MNAYIMMMNERPDVFLPLTELYIKNHLGEKFYLQDIIQAKCDANIYDKYKKYFEIKLESEVRTIRTLTYNLHKSDQTKSKDTNKSVDKENEEIKTKKMKK